MRRIVAATAVLAGLTLVVFTIGWQLFGRSADAEEISDRYRTLMSPQGLRDLRTGFEEVKAGGTELAGDALPELQQRTGMDDAEFAAYLDAQMKGAQAFADAAPTVVGIVDPVIATMEAASDDYHEADQIPISQLPLSSAPYLFLAVGVVLVAGGILVWRRPAPLPLAALAIVGAALVVVPIAIRIPQKIDAAERVSVVGRVGLAPATGERAVAATQLFDGAAADISTALPVAFARAMGTSESEAQTYVAQRFPALTRFAEHWPAVSGPSHELSDSQVELSDTFHEADQIPLGAVPWLFLVPGALLAVGAAAALARERTIADATVGADRASEASEPSESSGPSERARPLSGVGQELA
jgi:hypothetical protein